MHHVLTVVMCCDIVNVYLCVALCRIRRGYSSSWRWSAMAPTDKSTRWVCGQAARAPTLFPVLFCVYCASVSVCVLYVGNMSRMSTPGQCGSLWGSRGLAAGGSVASGGLEQRAALAARDPRPGICGSYSCRIGRFCPLLLSLCVFVCKSTFFKAAELMC